MEANNLLPSDINQLKKKILNRSASFKKKASNEQHDAPKYNNDLAINEETKEDNDHSKNNNIEELNQNKPFDGNNNATGQKLEDSVSSNNINMNIQARVLAFHEQRQNLKRSTSMKKPKDIIKGLSNNNSNEDFSQYNSNLSNEKEKPLSNAHSDNYLSEKRGSVGNSSPSTPIDVVNKPLPPLPTDKKRTNPIPQENIDTNSIANKTANHNSKLIEKKLQKMSLLQNRSKNLSSLLPRKKVFDDETSSVSSIVTTDSDPDFENESNNKRGTQLPLPNNSSASIDKGRKLSSSPTQTRHFSTKPSSPFRTTTFGMNKEASEREMNPKRKAPPVPSNFQFSTSNISTAQQSTTPMQNRSQQKVKMGLSARRGLKLDISQMHKSNLSTSSVNSNGNNTNETNLKLPVHSNKPSVDMSHSTDSISSTDSMRSFLKNNVNSSQILSKRSNNLRNSLNTTGTDSLNTNNPNNSIGSLSGVGSIFANFSKYLNIKNGSLNFAGKLSLSSDGINFSNGSSFSITLDELEYIGELGRGNYGNVSKVLHKPTQIIMAMKEVRLELDESKFRQILMELDVLHKCSSPYIVDFYGAFFVEGAVYMCMECMDGGSLDKLYSGKGACDDNGNPLGVPEPILAKIAIAVISGLKVLKDDHNIIHRDVKPTNILCSAKEGTVKLCDFGVSGNLVASLAKTNIGCQSYMAPERIKSFNPDAATYTVHSDIWSLGLTLLEVALGTYPYPPETFDNIFSQLSAIVDGKPPSLPKDRFSPLAQDFINCCLQKDPEKRPYYKELLEHPWLQKYEKEDVDMSGFFTERLKKIHEYEIEHNIHEGDQGINNGENNSFINTSMSSESNSIPPLHRGGLMSS
ncbi:related to MAP kinase kinase PBS2 [Hanseniaspora guilliermondii]|uniref:mitogen-activated protein kinase kinase n=1 Tax=Hanseniaspora guilliermondii TaxID=56406 RepID=A0A1L0D214_9ASCO|nr:related to MAP kinase kinase PBS2 [Hanseniaspora guilliermondii]